MAKAVHLVVMWWREGKRSWTMEEMVADPDIVPALKDAEARGLAKVKMTKPSKGLSNYGVPLAAVVVGLTPLGEAMAASG